MSRACFVIGPIGAEGSEVRRRSDQVLRHIIAPAAAECGYAAVRADQISEPGLITSQIIQRIVDDPLVIADLTGQNPNVFYELAIRHALRKPIVQILASDEVLPFDIAATRTIFVDHRDLDSASQAKEAMVKQIRAVESNPEEVDTPVSVALRVKLLAESENPLEQSSAAILAALQEVQAGLRELRALERRSPVAPDLVHEFTLLLAQLWRVLPSEEAAAIGEDQVLRIRDHIRAFLPLLKVLCSDAGVPLPDLTFLRRSEQEGRASGSH
jgi:hypothetical protein